MKTIFLILALASCGWAGGPKYGHSPAKLDDEITNIYHDIKSVNAGGIKGVTDGSNAQAGRVGEYTEYSSGLQNLPTSGQWGNDGSITLTAGDWDVFGVVQFLTDDAETGAITRAYCGPGTVTGNDSTGVTLGTNGTHVVFTSGLIRSISLTIPTWRVSLTQSQTYYLKVYATYTVQGRYRGTLAARRVR